MFKNSENWHEPERWYADECLIFISEATEVASRAKLLLPHSFHLFCCWRVELWSLLFKSFHFSESDFRASLLCKRVVLRTDEEDDDDEEEEDKIMPAACLIVERSSIAHSKALVLEANRCCRRSCAGFIWGLKSELKVSNFEVSPFFSKFLFLLWKN